MTMIGVRIAHDGDFPPLTFVEGGRSRGLVIDLAVDVLARAGYEPDFVAVKLADHETALRAGTADAVAFKAMVPRFAATYDQSSPLLTTGAAWFAPARNGLPEGGPPDGARVVTPASGPLVDLLKHDYPRVDLATVGTYAEALGSVVDGAADIAALNFHIGAYLARRDYPEAFAIPAAPFDRQPIAFCVLKGQNGELLDAFDTALRQALADGLGRRLERQWLGGHR